jgi:hypothetical protein
LSHDIKEILEIIRHLYKMLVFPIETLAFLYFLII